MNREDVCRMYVEANGYSPGAYPITIDELERFAARVAAAERAKWMERTAILIRGEREACAKECKFGRSSADIEQAIRARGAADAQAQ